MPSGETLATAGTNAISSNPTAKSDKKLFGAITFHSSPDVVPTIPHDVIPQQRCHPLKSDVILRRAKALRGTLRCPSSTTSAVGTATLDTPRQFPSTSQKPSALVRS